MSWVLSKVALGVRHKRLFGFLSRAGDVIDAVLPLQGTGPFPEKCFNKVGWPNQTTARIQDDDENFIVDCNIDGVILKVDVQATALTHQAVRGSFVELVQKVLPITGGDRFIHRVGVVDEYLLELEAPAKHAVQGLTRLQGIGEPADFSLRASFKGTTAAGLSKGGVNDWTNTILALSAEKKDKDSEVQDILRVSIDYQIYFSPERRFELALLEEHYAAFLERVEKLKQQQLANLVLAEVKL